jgi:hypothetical protein
VGALQAQEAETRRAGRRDGRGYTRSNLPAAPGEVAFGGVGVKPGVACSVLHARLPPWLCLKSHGDTVSKQVLHFILTCLNQADSLHSQSSYEGSFTASGCCTGR